MPRIVIKTATGPVEVKTNKGKGESIWICACGLTDNEDGTCSGNHRKLQLATEDPNKLYQYEDGQRMEVAELADDEEAGEKLGCCGGGGCGGGASSCCGGKDFTE